MSTGPLSRFKVIDLTRARAGPTAARQLADWGAQVIKIEAREGEEIPAPRDGPDFQNLHRNKRSFTLDIRKPEGLEIFYKLVKDADVVVENFRPDVKFRLKVDYESLRAINPRLVYGSISGYGQDGPYRERPGVDPIVQGVGGLMSVTGIPGQGPVRAGIAISDVGSGLLLAMGILIALLEREESGQGQWVHTSLLEALITLLDFQAARWLIAKEVPGQAGNNHPTMVPAGPYKTSDGLINIAATGKVIYSRFCEAAGLEHLLTDPDYSTLPARQKNRDKLNAVIEEKIKSRTSAEWIDVLNEAGVPCGPIYKIDEMFADPQVKHTGMAAPVVHPRFGPIEVVGQGIHMSRTPWQLRSATPDRGEHTDEVLHELGFDDATIASLRAAAVV